MSTLLQRLGLLIVLVTVLTTLVTSAPVIASTERQGEPPDPIGDQAIAAEASLHNPGFDNHIWYWFHERYDYARNLTPDALVPDDDTANGPQQWMLWYMHGTVPILTWATTGVHEGNRAVKGRTYWDGRHQAGLYQIIYNATPCLIYEFQMYGQAKLNEKDDELLAFRVGIDQVGYRPDTWAVDGFPDTTVWGASRTDSIDKYIPLSVTAEAWDSSISVYTYAEAKGGLSFETQWDTGSFQEVTLEVMPDLIDNPDDPPSPGGIKNLSVETTKRSATVSWTTLNNALGQVYYRFLHGPPPEYKGSPPGTLIPYVVYLPSIRSTLVPGPWLSTTLDTSATKTHAVEIKDLEPGSTYEYIVASRGPSGGKCVTWVSSLGTFTTAEGQ